ncbi:MAG: hypothetical protein N3E37_03430 [Candidatus Micrarchaeota archaeon]|nr:hypothetical protein [Candidatus Micrarchaeota archaeon]
MKKGQLITSDVVLSLSILVFLIYYVFLHVQNNSVFTDYTYQSLSRICKTHLYSGIATNLLDKIALSNSISEKNSLSYQYIEKLPNYVKGAIVIQNETDTFTYNLNLSTKLKENLERVTTSSILYANNGSSIFIGKVTVLCWYDKTQ